MPEIWRDMYIASRTKGRLPIHTSCVVKLMVGVAALFTLISVPFPIATASVKEIRHSNSHLEMRIPGTEHTERAPNDLGPYMVLECRNLEVNLHINWREPVGKQRELRPHLFHALEGDKHSMLRVLDADGQSTGYLHESPKAKSLVYAILEKSVPSDDIPFSIEVFPAGSDPDTGQWLGAFFSSASIRRAASEVGKVCQWEPTNPVPNAHEADYVSRLQ